MISEGSESLAKIYTFPTPEQIDAGRGERVGSQLNPVDGLIKAVRMHPAYRHQPEKLERKIAELTGQEIVASVIYLPLPTDHN